MAHQLVRIGAAASAIGAAALLAGCNPSVASLSCDRIAEEAKQTSQAQQYKINSITNVREVSRTEAEARCQGNASWSDNTTTDIYLRAYRDGGNTMVAYSATGFEAAGTGGAPQQPAAPPAQGVPGYDQPAGNGQ
jgi:hypothetical protein